MAVLRGDDQSGLVASEAARPRTVPAQEYGTAFRQADPASAPGWPKRVARSGVPARALTVVVYHHIAARADAFTDKLLVTTRPETFSAHLKFYHSHYDVIAPGDLATGHLPRRPLLITFDDAYRSVCDVAAPILREFGAEALFFINPAAVLDRLLPTDNLLCFATTVLGQDEVNRIAGVRPGAAPALPDLLMSVTARLPAPDLQRVRQALLDRLGYTEERLHARSELIMTQDQLANLRSYGLHPGNHTMTHRMLHALSAGELEDEIRRSKDRLEQATGQAVRWFSFPYGCDDNATPEALAVIAGSGHAGAFLVQGRLNRFQPSADLLCRISPRDAGPALLRTSLWLLPVLRTLRHAMRRSARGFRKTQSLPHAGGPQS